jgi:hypothetical protein
MNNIEEVIIPEVVKRWVDQMEKSTNQYHQYEYRQHLLDLRHYIDDKLKHDKVFGKR